MFWCRFFYRAFDHISYVDFWVLGVTKTANSATFTTTPALLTVQEAARAAALRKDKCNSKSSSSSSGSKKGKQQSSGSKKGKQQSGGSKKGKKDPCGPNHVTPIVVERLSSHPHGRMSSVSFVAMRPPPHITVVGDQEDLGRPKICECVAPPLPFGSQAKGDPQEIISASGCTCDPAVNVQRKLSERDRKRTKDLDHAVERDNKILVQEQKWLDEAEIQHKKMARVISNVNASTSDLVEELKDLQDQRRILKKKIKRDALERDLKLARESLGQIKDKKQAVSEKREALSRQTDAVESRMDKIDQNLQDHLGGFASLAHRLGALVNGLGKSSTSGSSSSASSASGSSSSTTPHSSSSSSAPHSSSSSSSAPHSSSSSSSSSAPHSSSSASHSSHSSSSASHSSSSAPHSSSSSK